VLLRSRCGGLRRVIKRLGIRSRSSHRFEHISATGWGVVETRCALFGWEDHRMGGWGVLPVLGEAPRGLWRGWREKFLFLEFLAELV
jgi:hypothetical protein